MNKVVRDSTQPLAVSLLDIGGGKPGAKTFQGAAERVEFPGVGDGCAGHFPASECYLLDKSLVRQLGECRTDCAAAHLELFRKLCFEQPFARRQDAFEDMRPDLIG